MKLKSVVKIGVATIALGMGVTIAPKTVSAHSFFYWEHPHWVTVTKKSTIVKIHKTYPLYKSYAVKRYTVKPGHHLKIHHVASYDWQVESGMFNSGSHYTYAVSRGAGTGWFKQGIHTIHTKKAKKSKPKKTSKPKNYDLDYNYAPSSLKSCIGKTVYSDEIIDSDMPLGLYKTENDFDSDSPAIKITRVGVPMTLTKLYMDSEDVYKIAQVTYKGNSYITDGSSDSGDLVPYNTESSSGVVISSHKPTETGSILLKHGQNINTSELWEYINPNTGNETDYLFSLSKNKWYVYNL